MSGGEYGKIYKRIWGDPDFKKLTGPQQLQYLKLLSQTDISLAGVLTLATTRWAMQTDDLTVHDVETAIEDLEATQFVVCDRETQEVLVRSYIRNDLGWRSPKTLKAISAAIGRVLSPALKSVISWELQRIDTTVVSDKISDTYGQSSRQYVDGVIAHLVAENPPMEPPWHTPSDTPCDTAPSTPADRGYTSSPLTPAPANAPAPAPAPANAPAQEEASEIADTTPDPSRPDVDELCEHLADRIEANGSKRPRITKTWRDAARLMLDRDQHPLDEIHRAIDWCQADEFWRANVLSMPKFREKWDQMRLQAARRNNDTPRLTMSEEIYLQERERAQALDSDQLQIGA